MDYRKRIVLLLQKNSDDKVLNIVFITDESYVVPTAVAVESLIKNKSFDTIYNVKILVDEVNPRNIISLKELQTDKVHIEIIDVKNQAINTFGQSNIPTSIHVSKAAMLKFYLPTIFSEIDKILYLDGDVIVRKDLYPLYSTDLGTNYVAAVADMKAMVHYQPNQNEKLGINSQFYFNSGVMLLNLKQMREDEISSRLVDYRQKGINYFMDQDSFNVVLLNHVLYLSFHFNAQYSNLSFFDYDEIKSYYKLNEKTYDDFLSDVIVLHLSSKEKPWIFYDMEFTEEWDLYYHKTPFRNITLKRRAKDNRTIETLLSENLALNAELKSIKKSTSYRIGLALSFVPRVIVKMHKNYRKKNIRYNPNGLNTSHRDQKIIVSLTSFPERINKVPLVVESLLNQSLKPDQIILYLSKQQFPECQCPPVLKKAIKYGLNVQFVDDDLKPHKKYYYAFQQFPNDLIITVDDDVRYSPKLIERLYKSYKYRPKCVSAMRVHKITFNSDGQINPYNKWVKDYDGKIGRESYKLIATGVGGVLYPPNCFNDKVFNTSFIKEHCLMADDLWLKIWK